MDEENIMPLEQPIGKEQVRHAMDVLQKYRAGKRMLEQRIIENEQFWKLRHWEQMRGKDANPFDPRPASGWLVNVVLNRHADAIDNYPEPNCLPRAADDQEEAKKLTKVLPVILRQCGFAQTYSDVWWYKLKAGTGVYGVFWDAAALNGLGDISIRKIDVLNLYWEPGITNIQDSRNVFNVEMVDNEVLLERYPQLEGKLQGHGDEPAKFLYDDNVDTTDKSLVVDWYYKRGQGGKSVLHYCKFCGDEVLYATENDRERPTAPDLATGLPVETNPSMAERGWYDHGKYPFVFDVLYPEEGTPCGFGFVDISKDAQKQIDLMNQAVLKNTLAGATPRFFIREDGSVNEEEFADWTKPFVHVNGNMGQDAILPIQSQPLNGNYITVLDQKIQELRETSGNTEANTGSVPSSVTAASAIAALQEASGKLSRDMIDTTYRAFEDICIMVIDLIRQFYDLPREFRITGEMGREEFTRYDNSGLQPKPQGSAFGEDMGYRSPVIDIEVVPQRESRYSKSEYNELALQLYGAGMFNPQMTDQALLAMSMMDFKGRDKVMQQVQMNGTLEQKLAQMSQTALMLAQLVDRANGTNMADQVAAQITGEAAPMAAPGGVPEEMPEENKESAVTAKARKQSNEAAQVR